MRRPPRARLTLPAGLRFARGLSPRSNEGSATASSTSIHGLVPGLLLLLAIGLSSGCERQLGVPVYRVEKGDLLHRITADGELEAAQTVQLSVPSRVQGSVTIAWMAPEGSRVKEGEVVMRFDALDTRKKLEDGQSKLQKVKVEKARSAIQGDQKLAKLEKNRRLASLELDHAQQFRRVDAQIFARQDILEDAIDEELASERQEHARQAMTNQTSLGRTELDILDIRERQAQTEIEAAEDGLGSLELRAPQAGILVYSRDWRGEAPQVGKSLWRSQTVAEIPDLRILEAQVFVLEADAGGLSPGLEAEVVVQARPDRVLKGKVARVEPVAKPRIAGSPVRYFAVDITFEESVFFRAGADGDAGAEGGAGKTAGDGTGFSPGQRVRATLMVENRKNVLTVPRQAIFEGADGESRVWVRSGRGFESRRVSLGPTNLGRAVIESGLEEGVLVALAEPAENERSDGDEPDTEGAPEASTGESTEKGTVEDTPESTADGTAEDTDDGP